MCFTTEKERDIITKINYWTKLLEDYINKETLSEKIGNKLLTVIKEKKMKIKKMDTYTDKDI